MDNTLKESRVFSTRHLTIEEKKAVIDCLRNSIRRGKIRISDRPENSDFMEKYHLSDQDVLKYLGKYIEPKDIKAALRSRKNPSEELYICNSRVSNSKVFLYVKFSLRSDGFVDVISFHGSSEPVYTSYEKASDFQDKSFEEKAMRKTVYNYKKFSNVNKNEIIDFFLSDNKVRFTFKDPVDEATKAGIIKSLPSDMGLDRKRMIKGMTDNSVYIEVPLFTKNF